MVSPISSGLTLRRGTADDAQACGRICHDAFAAIAGQHNFVKDFPSPEVATGLLSGLLSHPGWYAVVAERDGRVIGSNFMDERGPIFGVGPITVDPEAQDARVGHALMQRVLERAEERRAPGVRLLQDTFHNRSFALYTKLGFQMRTTTSVMQGRAIATEVPGCGVRMATPDDMDVCNGVCAQVHGHHRGGELADAIKEGAAMVVKRHGRLTGYTTGIGFAGHTAGETNEDLEALIASAREFGGPGFHVPNSNGELLRWCYAHGLQMVKAMTLMTIGMYNEPQGAYLPSVFY